MPEVELSADKLEILRRLFDEELARKNIEYDAKRQSGRLATTTVEVLDSGSYEQLRKHLVASGVPDAQVKVSHFKS